MDIPIVFKRLFLIFSVSAFLLPVAALFFFLFALVLNSWGDFIAGLLFKYAATGLSVLWGISLVSILLLLAVERVIKKTCEEV